MDYKGVSMLILLVFVTFVKTDAQYFYDDTDKLVKSIMSDPVFVLLDEQDQIRVLREIFTLLDKWYKIQKYYSE